MFIYKSHGFCAVFFLRAICCAGLFLAAPLLAQNTIASHYPYLLHLESVNFDDHVCVLLQRDGKFHLETERGDRTRVFEGALSAGELLKVQGIIDDEGLKPLTQKQIPAPPKYVVFDELHVDIFRGDHWQDLFFPDFSTRKPFNASLKPLLRWMDELHKEPHVEISEDEGKNDCQLPKRIVLKRRKVEAHP